MNYTILFAIFILCFLCGWQGTKIAKIMLEKINAYDHPNERSSHSKPVLRGGGAIIADCLLLFGIIITYFITESLASYWPLFVALFFVSIVSFVDDIKSVSISSRLLVQILAVYLGLKTLAGDIELIAGEIPLFLIYMVAGILWVWFINLYNFMDGIDGLAASESVAIAIGVLLISLLVFLPDELVYFAVIIAGSALGFLMLNWHPAKIFLGDVGSVTLGYALGWMLLKIALIGYWPIALILPGYFLFDSGYTLTKRLLNGKKIWQAHKEHFYQKMVQSGKSHSAVTGKIIILNIVLITLAILAVLLNQQLLALFLAFLITAAFCRFL